MCSLNDSASIPANVMQPLKLWNDVRRKNKNVNIMGPNSQWEKGCSFRRTDFYLNQASPFPLHQPFPWTIAKQVRLQNEKHQSKCHSGGKDKVYNKSNHIWAVSINNLKSPWLIVLYPISVSPVQRAPQLCGLREGRLCPWGEINTGRRRWWWREIVNPGSRPFC